MKDIYKGAKSMINCCRQVSVFESSIVLTEVGEYLYCERSSVLWYHQRKDQNYIISRYFIGIAM